MKTYLIHLSEYERLLIQTALKTLLTSPEILRLPAIPDNRLEESNEDAVEILASLFEPDALIELPNGLVHFSPEQPINGLTM